MICWVYIYHQPHCRSHLLCMGWVHTSLWAQQLFHTSCQWNRWRKHMCHQLRCRLPHFCMGSGCRPAWTFRKTPLWNRRRSSMYQNLLCRSLHFCKGWFCTDWMVLWYLAHIFLVVVLLAHRHREGNISGMRLPRNISPHHHNALCTFFPHILALRTFFSSDRK